MAVGLSCAGHARPHPTDPRRWRARRVSGARRVSAVAIVWLSPPHPPAHHLL